MMKADALATRRALGQEREERKHDEVLHDEQPAGHDEDRHAARAGREQHGDQHDVDGAEKEHREEHPGLQAGVLSERSGAGHARHIAKPPSGHRHRGPVARLARRTPCKSNLSFSAHRRRLRRLSILVAAAALPLVLWAVLPVVSRGASPQGKVDQLQRKIDATQGRIGRRKGTEQFRNKQ